MHGVMLKTRPRSRGGPPRRICPECDRLYHRQYWREVKRGRRSWKVIASELLARWARGEVSAWTVAATRLLDEVRGKIERVDLRPSD